MEEISDIQKRYLLRLWLVLTPYILFYPALAAIMWLSPNIYSRIFSDVSVVVAYSCISLLGIWVGLSGIALWRRVIGAALGIINFAIMVIVDRWILPTNITYSTMKFDCMSFLSEFFLQSVVVAGSLLLIHGFGVRLRLLDPKCRQDKGFQFSLLSLMGLTLAVALLFAAINTSQVDWINKLFVPYTDLHFLTDVCLPTMVVALIAVWAGLAQGRTLIRLLIGLFAASFVGFIFWFAKTRIYRDNVWLEFVVMPMYMFFILQYIFIILPLLVVRSMGYRIVNSSQHE